MAVQEPASSAQPSSFGPAFARWATAGRPGLARQTWSNDGNVRGNDAGEVRDAPSDERRPTDGVFVHLKTDGGLGFDSREIGHNLGTATQGQLVTDATGENRGSSTSWTSAAAPSKRERPTRLPRI
jgi:hypothetical protein